MTARKPFTLIAAALLALMAAVHIFRIVMPFEVTVGRLTIPHGVSMVAALLLTVLAVMLVREARR